MDSLTGPMSPGLLGPFDVISPQQILTQYSDWLYFTLVLIFFIAVAGLTLRRHFDQPYVKPLIISVGLMLTVALFMKRDWLLMLFDGWGVVGALLLVIVVAVIPYGLARGFGMSAGKAFYLTYILFYILSWVKFSAFYTGLAEHRLGIVNVAFLLFFFYSIYRLLAGSAKSSLRDIKSNISPATPELQREIKEQTHEGQALTRQAWPLTRQEIKTVKDMEEALFGVQKLVEHGENRLSKGDRDKAVLLLRQLVKGENVLKGDLVKIKRLLAGISSLDARELDSKRKRLNEAKGDEKQVLRAEIHRQEMKLRAEKTIQGYEQRLVQGVEAFQNALNGVINILSRSPYPLDARPLLVQARTILNSIKEVLSQIAHVEEKLVDFTKEEQRLLKQEQRLAKAL